MTAIFALAWDTFKLDHAGLIPAIIQDATSQQVLMLGYMNRLAFEKSLTSGSVHFWSRSRQELWRKGETSGNTLTIHAISIDCDADALLIEVHPAGPVCHTGAQTCFYRRTYPESTHDE